MSLSRSLLQLRAAAAPALARIAARPAAGGVVRASPKLMTAIRQYSQSQAVQAEAAKPAAAAPAAAAAAPAAAAAEPKSFSEIVQSYGGWYPFLGLASVIAVSKEVIILNEELLLATNFFTMFGILYLALGDVVTKGAEEQRAEIAKRHDDLSDFHIEQLQTMVTAHELNIAQVEVLKALKAEYNTLATDLQKARAIKLRQNARDAVVKRLAEIKSREASERASFKEVVGAKASAYVRRTFASSPAAVKAQLVDFAIDVVEGKKKQLDAKADPVKKLYADYFNNKIYEKEIAEEKQSKQ